MTRTDNSTISLADRLTASRNARPICLYLSTPIVCPIMLISRKSADFCFYREVLSKPAAQLVYDTVIKEHGKTNTVNKKNFYVRNTWAPHS